MSIVIDAVCAAIALRMR